MLLHVCTDDHQLAVCQVYQVSAKTNIISSAHLGNITYANNLLKSVNMLKSMSSVIYRGFTLLEINCQGLISTS